MEGLRPQARLSLWRRNTFSCDSWAMAKKKALGDCYRWAYNYVQKHPGAALYQGRVISPFADGPKEPYGHAWVVHNGIVKDWQTMVAGMGGKYNGVGWPESTWNHAWQPHKAKVYGAEDARAEMAKNGHYGPW